MQKVSKAYRESMKDILRERAYIMITFGLLNQEAQSKAKIDSGDFTYYSNKDNLFSRGGDDTIYATLEEDFTKVDGSMFFLPRRNAGDAYYDTGLIGAGLVSDAPYELIINLHTLPLDFKGLTINFGENYPIDFDVVSSQGQVIEFRDNDTGEWSTEEVLESTTYVKLIFYRMKKSQSRLRIYSLRFGYGLVYYNDSVMKSQLDSYVSPIGADVPQIDFSVTLKNYDKYFNVDNPTSALNYLETGQEMDIYYGYQLPDTEEIEWIRGNHLLCSAWESDDFTATIRCQDVFRSMDAEYYKGTYNSAGVSYYNLAEAVLADAGQENYYIDPRLKNLYSKNPLPRVKHKEALQIIANACRCVLTQTRMGTIQIKSNFAPEAEAQANSQTAYSHVENILEDDIKDEYGSLATEYTITNGGMFFLPRTGEATKNTGFVSEAISDENGLFAVNPKVTIIQEAQCLYHGAKMIFGNALPGGFTIRTYNNNELVEEYINQDTITKTMFIIHDFDDFDKMEIEFTSTAEPYNRIILNNFAFGDITDFTMTRNDMTSSPKAIKQELIKEVIVPCYSYQNGTTQESLVSEELTTAVNQIVTFYVGEPSYNFTARLDDSTANVQIIEYGSYYVKVKFLVAGTHRLDILGYRYKIVERQAVKQLHVRGKTIKWENPLMSDPEMAADLCDWLSDYYTSGIEYEYNTRGFPEIDSNDIVYQENEFHEGMKVNIYRQTLTFDQAFGGKVVARRQGG